MENANEVKTIVQEKENAAASSRKPAIIFIVVALLLVVGGLLWLAVNQYQQPASQVSPQTTVAPKAVAPTPTPATLDEQLNSITVEDTDSDFATIDSDLQNL